MDFSSLEIRSLKMVGIINVAFLGAVVAVTLSALHGNTKLMSVGLLCTGLTIGMYASPLSAMIPNGIGFLLGSAQIILYFIYYQSTPAKEEEGPAHLAKGGIEMPNHDATKSNGKDPSEARAHT
nr:bidirectional sugar transporter SWEET16-like [Ipomoea batatas]